MSSIDLISLKIHIWGRELVQKFEVQIPVEEGMDKMKKVKKKRKMEKKNDPPPPGFEPQTFEQNFPAQDSNIEGD